MRLNQRHYDASKIKEINHTTFKKDYKEWIKCDKCETWLWEETYFKAKWRTGRDSYHPAMVYNYWSTDEYRICTECCPTTLAVVDYLTELTEKNEEAYDKSLKKWERDEKKKEGKAKCIVDGKSYTLSFSEIKE